MGRLSILPGQGVPSPRRNRSRGPVPPPPVPRAGQLRTLADARAYLLTLDPYRSERNAWQSAAAKLIAASDGADVEPATTQVEFALMMDGRWTIQ
mgnify:CR=1 FL=1